MKDLMRFADMLFSGFAALICLAVLFLLSGCGGGSQSPTYPSASGGNAPVISNTPPVANAGPDQAAVAGSTVELDGTASSDPDGDSISYLWTMVIKPADSGAALEGWNTANPSFVADYVGYYRVRLTVSDGIGSSEANVGIQVAGVDYHTNAYGMSFNRIPAGSFVMGSPIGEAGRDTDERQHLVDLTKDYFMMTTEVSQGQWQAVTGSNPSAFPGCADCPVENVAWEEVQGFITALNALTGETYRLPTEAEWEYAARAGTATATYEGNLATSGGVACEDDWVLNGIAWYCANSGSKTTGGKQKKENPWGLFDMLGNVQEWTADWYGSYPTDLTINPTGPAGGSYRVCRGGGWGSRPALVRAAYRWRYAPTEKFSDLGFRLVLPAD